LQQLSREETATFEGESFVSSRLSLPSVTRPVNILILGMSVLPPDVKNSSPGTQSLGYLPQVHSVDGLSDTMLLVRFNPKTNGMTLLSIPRDTRVVMEKYGVQKINAANVHGGPVLAASEVSKLLGNVEISRYARINVLAVGKLVDALGGLTIDVPKDMKYTDESQHLYINLKKGEQLLNGDQVMQFLRFRHDASGDIGRVQRQQLVIRAVIQQAINPLKIAAIPQVVEAIKSDVDSNLNVEELMALLLFATRVDRSQVQSVVLPGNTNGNGRRSVSYWLPDRDRINQMMATYFYQGTQKL
jgi:LCP family protein required for cell wall assembly